MEVIENRNGLVPNILHNIFCVPQQKAIHAWNNMMIEFQFLAKRTL